jgi:glucose-6-phosphate isomerase
LDFLLPALSSCDNQPAHDLAIANCLAQAEAFAFGQKSPDPQKVHEGNRPSSVLLFRRLDPGTLGALIALYEHKVFTQSVIWGINAFDQWGVELGKALAQRIIAELGQPETASLAHDSSTNALIARYRRQKQ